MDHALKLSILLLSFQVLVINVHITVSYGVLADTEDPRVSMKSIIGDSGMLDSRVRVALESWNFCNRVGTIDNSVPSPRQADCTDILCNRYPGDCQSESHVNESDNQLKSGQPFPQGSFISFLDPDDYAVQKELYLGSLCQVNSSLGPWNFWMIMLKNGNFDLSSSLCPSTTPSSTTESSPTSSLILPKTSRPFINVSIIKEDSRFPCFGFGCMNHPMIYHNKSSLQPPICKDNVTCNQNETSIPTLSGSFYGTYDIDNNSLSEVNKSYFSIVWSKDPETGSWLFHHILRVNERYPWLMLYLRVDATKGLSGGYPWETRGMMVQVPESPNFIVRLNLNVLQGGGPKSQFYLLDIGGCWKNDGSECDGDTTSDVTRYSEMIINPATDNWCRPNNIALCPPYHVDAKTGRHIHRNETYNFPYKAYHYYCVPSNAKFVEQPYSVCDPYSNPQPQELMQLLPHPEWAIHGYPSKKGQGWIGDPTTWILDVGGLSQRLYFYQDPNTQPAQRKWTSIDVGTEIYISRQLETAEWTVSDFDVLVK